MSEHFTHPLKRMDVDTGTDGGGRPRLRLRLRVIAQLVFWSWNGLLATIAVFGLVPILGIAFVRDALTGIIPPSLLLALVGLVLLPLASIAVGLRIHRDPWRLLGVFYGVEAPLLVVGIVRLFLVHELTAQLAVAGGVALVGLAAFAVSMMMARARQRGLVAAGLFAGVGVLGLITVAFSVLAALYGLPALVSIVQEIDLFAIIRQPQVAVFLVLAVTFVLYTATLALAAPLFATAVYVVTLRRLGRVAARDCGARRVAFMTLVVAALACAALMLSARQPHTRAFALLATPPRDDAARTTLVAESAIIRDGLVDAYLAPYRYIAVKADGSAIAELYAARFGGQVGDYAILREFNDFMVAPFLYDAAASEGVAAAAARYAAFFDTTIEEAEQQRISDAMSASWQRQAVGASLLDRNSERVRVSEQELMVTPHGDWAEIELHETYVNVSDAMQEVLYHFELPESAVVTGLWLGETADKSAANAFQVAPRGAAQRVYRQQVQRAFDPALLEQVGPRQYRLRVFPILPETQGEAPQPAHLWLSVAVMREGGQYPLPHLTERRNAFFTGARHVLDGHAARWDGWLPASVLAPHTAVPTRLIDVDGFTVQVGPRDAVPGSLAGQRVAIVVDRSRSMQKHAAALAGAVERLRALVGDASSIDVVLAAAPSRGESARTTTLGESREFVFYGGQALSDMLRDARALVDADVTFVLTDDDGVKHETDERPLAWTGALWLVHVDDSFPSAYADVVTDVLTRPLSGIAGSVDDAVAKYAAARDGHLVDGEHVWSLTASREALVKSGGLEALAARALVRLAAHGMVHADSHSVAVRHGIVSPVSSMIVLVTEAQRAALVSASSAPDAFQRATETGTVTAPLGFVTGVPEPEECLLVTFVGGLVLIAATKRRNRPMSPALRETCA